MARVGVNEDEMEKLITQAAGEEAVEGLTAHKQMLLVDIFKATYFQVDGLNEVAMTTKGTRPGDPVGDILFNMLMTAMPDEVTDYIRQRVNAVWQGAAELVRNLHQPCQVPHITT